MRGPTIPIPAWAERVADALGEGPHVVVTGISPSGHIHNLREVLVAEAVAEALRARGLPTRFIFHADTIDPLRKLAPGIPQSFRQYMGHSLSRVPDPEGCHSSYAEHFLSPFERALGEMGMDIEVLRSHELYESGVYTEVTREALDLTPDLRRIMGEVTGRQMPQEWSPYQPRAACGDLTGNRVTGHLPDDNRVTFVDREGNEGVADYSKGEGKLSWRVELAARWKALGVTFEPFGKDHTSRGGSTDTADRIAREVFGYPVPGRYEYEWIYIKGQGAMSSSRGIVLLPEDLLQIMPPNALRQMMLGRDPGRALELDLGEGFPRFMDEYYGQESVPFSHLVTLSQTVGVDGAAASEMLRRGGYAAAAEDPVLEEKLTHARNWSQRWAPEEYRLEVQKKLPEQARNLDEEQRRYLLTVAGRLKEANDGDTMQNMLYTTAKELGIKPKKAFSAIYLALLGRGSGPKAGPFLASMPVETVKRRFEECDEGHMNSSGSGVS